jgi:intracellular sulfur oxidation DsrE/DsrF family protein
MLRNISLILTLFLGFFLLPQIASSQQQNDILALHNLSELKVYFDVKADSAPKLEKRLAWINDTYEQVSQKGLKASFIIGFRSKASFFVTKGDDYIDEEDILTKGKIEKWLKHLVKLGIPLEQCSISAGLYDIDPQDFLPEITVVTNGYVSIAGYQNKGYAYVPM